MAPLRLAQRDKQTAIATFSGLAADAAALVLQTAGAAVDQSAARALGLLEAGRAVLLSQVLNTRSDLGDLQDRHPELAARFIELRVILDQPGDITTTAGERRHLAEEFTGLTAQILAAEGFESFGRPPDSSELLAQADAGPVVTVNLSVHRSDALILTRRGLSALPLPTLSPDAVTRQVNAFHEAGRSNRRSVVQDIPEWLWDDIVDPILRLLDIQYPPNPQDNWPRVWWVAGGPLSRLPLHAAGHHNDPPARNGVRHWIGSSPPTRPRSELWAMPGNAKPARPCLRSAPSSWPCPPLRACLRKVRWSTSSTRCGCCRTASGPVLLIEPEPGEHATACGLPTKANVLTHLPGTAIAHFACHGYSDPTDPSKSLLLLHDHHSDPLNVAALAPVALDDAQLAYLSACSTATTIDAKLQDEAVHLASAFQLAGFPHVIGTLWQINDQIAVQITQEFYAALSAADAPDTTVAAHALHRAVLYVRDKYPKFPSVWAAHIHTGA